VISAGQGRGGIPAASSSGAFDRLSQPFHGEFDIGRLKIAAALDLGPVHVLWETLEVFHGQLPRGERSLVNFSPMNESWGMAPSSCWPG
jgi:hypothetical protein